MLSRRRFFAGASLVGAVFGLGGASGALAAAAERFEFNLSDTEWRKRLSPQQYAVLRRHDTERAGTSPLNTEHRRGVFACAGCKLDLYRSQDKFESGTGWPSFIRPIPGAVRTRMDTSFFSVRTEVHCRRCGGHLGHVFDDGPPPTGKRYCMNGAALTFRPG